MPKAAATTTTKTGVTPRVPLNTVRNYYTMAIVGPDNTTYTFLTKYGYVYPASEFENEGRCSYALSCAVNEKIEKELVLFEEGFKKVSKYADYKFVSPIKEKDIDGEPVKFINIKLRRDIKNPDGWLFQGSLPEPEDDCLLRILPRYFVSVKNLEDDSVIKEIGVYFELKAVEH